jgi:hypothetical protein
MSKKGFEMLEVLFDKSRISEDREKIITAAAFPGLKRTQIEGGNRFPRLSESAPGFNLSPVNKYRASKRMVWQIWFHR